MLRNASQCFASQTLFKLTNTMTNKSSILKDKCPHCGSIAIEVSRSELPDLTLVLLECGHTIIPDRVTGTSYDLESADGRKLRDFQKVGIQFAETSNVRCLIGDEMGLGKTVQALGTLKLHPELLPCLIVCKSALMFQWFGETIRWCGHSYLPQMITSSKTKIVPGFPVYIISYDLLRRLSVETKSQLQVKTVILDECQKIKNHLSIRAKEVQLVCKDVEHILALSGTPITNNAGEYFTILNLLQPRRFPYYAQYIRDFCDSYESSWSVKVGGIKNPDYFKQLTEDFIIRRTRVEVAPELPVISRNFFNVELQKEFEKAYDKAQQELEDEYYSTKDNDGSLLSAIEQLTKLRHIVGWNKVKPTVQFVEDFLLDTEPTTKITIFTHHLDVTEALVANLQEMLVLNNLTDISIERISAAQSMDARHQAITRFRDNANARVCVASTLAAGEGLNMQFCNDCILMERQWTPASEEQVEGRLIRIGRKDETLPVTATYMIAVGTIDEFFTELVEQKRAIVSSTLDGKEIAWNEQSLMKELLDAVATRGGKRWKLS